RLTSIVLCVTLPGPPLPTLFPYTTLFRSACSSPLRRYRGFPPHPASSPLAPYPPCHRIRITAQAFAALQSRSCGLYAAVKVVEAVHGAVEVQMHVATAAQRLCLLRRENDFAATQVSKPVIGHHASRGERGHNLRRHW